MGNRTSRLTGLIDSRERGLVVCAIVTVVFNVLAFVIPFKHDAVFWIAWAFALVAIAAQCLIFVFFFDKVKTLRSRVTKIPLLEIGIIYFFVQMVASFLFMIVGTFVGIPYQIALVVFVLIIGISAILFIVIEGGEREIERQDESIRSDTNFMRMLGADVQALIPRAVGDADKAALNRLAEQLRYSDPVRTEGLEGVEAEIGQAFLTAKQAVVSGDEAAQAHIEELGNLLNERNLKAKVLKQQRL